MWTPDLTGLTENTGRAEARGAHKAICGTLCEPQSRRKHETRRLTGAREGQSRKISIISACQSLGSFWPLKIQTMIKFISKSVLYFTCAVLPN